MIKAIVVDDEKPARDEMKALLAEAGGVEVVAEASSTKEVIEKLQDQPCDVLFMDINMPDATGLQLASALQQIKLPPAVVFATAYSQYAVEAFEVKASDYLLKPVELERLKATIAKVEQEVQIQASLKKTKHIPCERSGKKVLVAIADIKYCTARDDYAYVETSSGRYFSTISLSQIEKELEGFGFMRVHRGYLVNLSHVTEVESLESGGMELNVKDCEDTIPVSRRKIPLLKKALNL